MLSNFKSQGPTRRGQHEGKDSSIMRDVLFIEKLDFILGAVVSVFGNVVNRAKYTGQGNEGDCIMEEVDVRD